MTVLEKFGGKVAKRIKRTFRQKGAKSVRLFKCGPWAVMVCLLRSDSLIGKNQWRVSFTGDVRPTDEAVRVMSTEACPDVALDNWDIVEAKGTVHAWQVVEDLPVKRRRKVDG